MERDDRPKSFLRLPPLPRLPCRGRRPLSGRRSIRIDSLKNSSILRCLLCGLGCVVGASGVFYGVNFDPPQSNPSRKRKSATTDEFATNKAPRVWNTTARPAHQGRNNGNDEAQENTREPREYERDQENIRDRRNVREQESDEERSKERRIGIG